MKKFCTRFCTNFQTIDRKTKKPPSKADYGPREPRPPRYSWYAPLSAPCSHILDEALQTDLIPPPRKMLNQPNADTTKYCKYHRNNGHTTNDCKA